MPPPATGHCTLLAGAEHSVAATKTFVNSCTAALWLLAEWAQDKVLLAALHDLPEALARPSPLTGRRLRAALETRESLYCLGADRPMPSRAKRR